MILPAFDPQTPAQAGVHGNLFPRRAASEVASWVPAFAGTGGLGKYASNLAPYEQGEGAAASGVSQTRAASNTFKTP